MRTQSIRFDDDIDAKVKQKAENEHRSFNQMVNLLLRRYFESLEHQNLVKEEQETYKEGKK